MAPEGDLGKKLEEYNEFLLKNAAITFSMEGVSKDIRTFLQRKIDYDTEMMKHITSLFRSATCCESKEVQKTLLNKESLLRFMLEHSFKEMKVTDMVINLIIQKLLEREAALNSEPQNKPTKSAGKNRGTK